MSEESFELQVEMEMKQHNYILHSSNDTDMNLENCDGERQEN